MCGCPPHFDLLATATSLAFIILLRPRPEQSSFNQSIHVSSPRTRCVLQSSLARHNLPYLHCSKTSGGFGTPCTSLAQILQGFYKDYDNKLLAIISHVLSINAVGAFQIDEHGGVSADSKLSDSNIISRFCNPKHSSNISICDTCLLNGFLFAMQDGGNTAWGPEHVKH